MKPFLLLIPLLAVPAFGDLIPLSAFRSVSISGTAGAESYSQLRSSSSLGNFAASISDSADWQDPGATSVEYFGNFYPAGFHHTESSATQTSTISGNGISISSSIFGDSWTSLAGPYNLAESRAASIFEAAFRILEPQVYDLDSSFDLLIGHGFSFPHLSFSLSGATYGSIFPTPFQGRQNHVNHVSGLLLPDLYTLRIETDISTAPDPLGYDRQVDYELDLTVAPVPDAGSTLALLGMALCAIGGISRKLNLA
jgi:VPDSG-CTERM motif